MRKRTGIRDGTVDQGSCILQERGIRRALAGKHFQTNLGSGEILAEAVVQFPGDTSPLFVLHLEQLCREFLQSCSALFDESLERVVGSLQCFFGDAALPKVVPHLILPAAREQCASHRTD